jgi:hypothetical protein
MDIKTFHYKVFKDISCQFDPFIAEAYNNMHTIDRAKFFAPLDKGFCYKKTVKFAGIGKWGLG